MHDLPSDKEIIKKAKLLVTKSIQYINIQFQEKIGLDVIRPSHKEINNITRGIDQWVHNFYHTELKNTFGDKIIIAGEEAKGKKRWRKGQIVASIDAIDGTDLLWRGLYNWCTAVAFFIPNERLIATMVGVPSGVVYHADESGAYKTEIVGKRMYKRKIKIPQNTPETIIESSLCFYGQKATNFLSLFERQAFYQLLKDIRDKESKAKNIRSPKKKEKYTVPFRIYDLGGNPMMIRLIEGTVDTVLEVKGHKLYDFIPGAYIAMKAGAYWGDLLKRKIDDEYIKKNLLSYPNPAKLRYILSCSEKLYEEWVTIFHEPLE